MKAKDFGKLSIFLMYFEGFLWFVWFNAVNSSIAKQISTRYYFKLVDRAGSTYLLMPTKRHTVLNNYKKMDGKFVQFLEYYS